AGAEGCCCCVADPRAGRCPPPRPSPACGGRRRAAHPPPRPWPPSPVGGGGLRWGQSPTAAPQVLASDAAPIPAFPRMRGKEQGGPAASTPVTPPPPLAGEGRGGGEPCPRQRKRAPQSAGPRPCARARRNSAAVAVRVARQRALDAVPRGAGRVACAVPVEARIAATALVLGAQVRLGLLEVAVGEPRAAFVTGAVGRRIVLVA